MMATLELLLDDLGKEAKEAPGWITLWAVCNLALWHDWHLEAYLGRLGREETTIATAAAIVLFFLGDVLDILVFPRRSRDFERLIRNLMVVSFTIGAFLIFAQQIIAGMLALAPWFLLFQLHGTLRRRPVPEKSEGKVGCTWLETPDLESKRDDAIGELGIRTGIYGVSKVLAQRAGEYFGKRPWIENESSKLIRSLALPALGAGVYFIYAGQIALGAAAVISFVPLLVLYGRLKSRHMRDLYAFAATQTLTFHPVQGPIAATWNGLLIAVCERGEWRGVPPEPSRLPYPSPQALAR